MFAVYSSTAVDASLEEKYQARMDPRRECKHADMAHGTAAMGPKCWVASMAPRAEFCIPTSIELVRAAFSGTPIAYLLTVYPRKKPPAWRAKIPATSLTPAAMTATLFDAMTWGWWSKRYGPLPSSSVFSSLLVHSADGLLPHCVLIAIGSHLYL